MARELGWELAQLITARGWPLKGPVSVEIRSDPHLERGAYRVTVAVVEQPAGHLQADPQGFPAVAPYSGSSYQRHLPGDSPGGHFDSPGSYLDTPSGYFDPGAGYSGIERWESRGTTYAAHPSYHDHGGLSGRGRPSVSARLVSNEGWYFQLPCGTTVIGSERADLVFAGAWVSPWHVRLVFDGRRAQLSRIDGTVPLHVNGQPVVTSRLSPGAEIQLGAAVVRYVV